MKPLQQLLATSDRERLPAFLSMCASPARIQEEVLLDILQSAADTEWGRAHAFNEIRSIADYRERQSVTEWPEYEGLAQRMEKGEGDLLFPGLPVQFLMTSATEGAQKLLPESAQGLDAKNITGKLRLAALIHAFPELAREGLILPLANRPEMGRTSAGIPFGTASGSTLENLAGPLANRLAFPMAVLQAEKQEDLDYLILRFALEGDVRAIVGNNAGRMVALLELANRRREDLIRDIATGSISTECPPDLLSKLRPNPERAEILAAGIQASGRLLPVHAWPKLRLVCFWLSGSVGRYMVDLEPWLPTGVAQMDFGYGATEAKFNIPLQPGRAAGPLALHAQFLEFQPLEGGSPLLAHELEDGTSYRLLLTTYSGLYRYDLHDIVRVEGFTAACPNIVFETKAADLGNITGERLSGPALLRIIGKVFAEAGIRTRHWCAATDLDRHGYDLCLELTPESAALTADLPQRLDAAIQAEVFTYRLFREQDMLKPFKLRIMREGWQERIYAQKLRLGVSINQIKLQVVVPSVPLPEMETRTME